MKKIIATSAIVAAIALTSGCSTIARHNHATDTASLDARALTVANRPVELGMEASGEASATATTTRVFGILVEGDSVKASMPIFGKVSADPLVRLAAYRAARSNGSDAFYVLRTEEDATGLGFLYGKRTVTVYGKTYKLKDLGLMSAERADKLNTTNVNVGSSAGGGILGSLFGK